MGEPQSDEVNEVAEVKEVKKHQATSLKPQGKKIPKRGDLILLKTVCRLFGKLGSDPLEQPRLFSVEAVSFHEGHPLKPHTVAGNGLGKLLEIR